MRTWLWLWFLVFGSRCKGVDRNIIIIRIRHFDYIPNRLSYLYRFISFVRELRSARTRRRRVVKAALLQEGRVLARGIASSKKPVSSTPITIHDASLDNPATFVVWFGCCDGDGASSILAEILPVLLRLLLLLLLCRCTGIVVVVRG